MCSILNISYLGVLQPRQLAVSVVPAFHVCVFLACRMKIQCKPEEDPANSSCYFKRKAKKLSHQSTMLFYLNSFFASLVCLLSIHFQMYISTSTIKFFVRCSSLLCMVNISLCLASAIRMESKVENLSTLLPLRSTRFTYSNLQMFTTALGEIVAPPIAMSNDSQRPYEVNGSTFPDFATAAKRSCDIQYNSCQDVANEKARHFTVGDCDNQRCRLIIVTKLRNG